MFFYPDQYLYEPYQRTQFTQARKPTLPKYIHQHRHDNPVHATNQRKPQEENHIFQYPFVGTNQRLNHPFALSYDGSDDEPEQFAQFAHRTQGFPGHQVFRSPYEPSQYFIVQDNDEMEALRAYREKKQREAELTQRRREAIIRQQEAARLAQEQLERERRMRAAAEQNARAAARAYIRRKQAEQVARLQKEYEEKKQRQQDVLEKLLNPWIVHRETEAPEQYKVNETEQDDQGSIGERDHKEEQALAQEEAKRYIRMLVDSFAPTVHKPEPSESSDEEQIGDDEVESVEESDGPHCETASDISDGNVSEIVDPQYQPPNIASSEFSDEPSRENSVTSSSEIPPETTSPSSKQFRHKKSKPLQSKRKKHRTREGNVLEGTPADIVEQLHVWKNKLESIKQAEQSLDSETTDPSAVSAAKRQVRSLIVKTEEIYNNLDTVRVAKDYRKLKHDLTSDAVSMADKLELALLRLNQAKSAPKYHVTLEDVTDDDSN